MGERSHAGGIDTREGNGGKRGKVGQEIPKKKEKEIRLVSIRVKSFNGLIAKYSLKKMFNGRQAPSRQKGRGEKTEILTKSSLKSCARKLGEPLGGHQRKGEKYLEGKGPTPK